MIKFTQPAEFAFNVEAVSLVTDPKSLTKRAGVRHLLKYEKTAGQEDLHIIALGAYEGTGFNRNGDGFTEADCIKNHGYFTKAARAIHRHHKNKPNDPKYGNIKAAAYNPTMKRIELIIGLDRDKCADILDEQEKTGNTNWSMASKQAHDICTWCGHKAASDKDRCEHIPAKLGELNDRGELCGMMNPDPHWFEMSYVYRPADRIGMSLGKVASDNTRPMLPRDFLNIYGEVYVPEDVMISKKAAEKRSLLKKLAEMEKHVEGIAHSTHPSASKDLFMARYGDKLGKGDGGGLSKEVIDQLRKYNPAVLLRTLADHGIIFSPDDFAQYLFGDRVSQEHVQGMKTHLPGIHQQLESEGAGDTVNNERYEPSERQGAPQELKEQAQGLHAGHSMHGEDTIKRIMQAMIAGGGGPGQQPAPQGNHVPPQLPPEAVSKQAFDKELAKQYTAYKLAMFNYLQDKNKLDEDMLWNCLLQNRY